MALLELPALPDLAPSAAGAQRLQELLRARFKVEVRFTAASSSTSVSCCAWRCKSRARWRRAGLFHILWWTLLPHSGHTKLYTTWSLSEDMCHFSAVVWLASFPSRYASNVTSRWYVCT